MLDRDLASLHSYVRYYDGALAPEFCTQMIREFEQFGERHTPNGRGHHPGIQRSTWMELNLTPIADQAFLGFFHAQIDQYLADYNKSLPLTLPVPSRPTIDDLRIKRYRVANDDQFETHFDSIDVKAQRYLVFLWYLNDVMEGGETAFVDLDIRIAPKTGRLLMFPPYWMFQHAGLPPISGEKYILSTYLMF